MSILLTTLNARYIHTSLGLRYLYANMQEYQPKTDSMMIYSATAGLGDVKAFRSGKGNLVPFLHEFKYGTKDSLFEMKFIDSKAIGYRALSIDLEPAFK